MASNVSLDASPNVVSSTDTFAISSASHGVMAMVFGEEFTLYLPGVVPPLLQSCKQAEHGEINVSTFSNTEAAAASASGLSPTNAITVTNDVNVNGSSQRSLPDVQCLPLILQRYCILSLLQES
ncbi:hypothetical protein DFH29DRAFT_1018009 [Suillus ampliporus]|nr:hypothetical protein DFH29DRAFT_1018009 [Suillus ampliporus]